MSDHVSIEQLSLLLDGQLSLASREAVISHIRVCPRCAARHDQLIELTASLQLQRPLEWSPALTAATLQKLGDPAQSRPPLRALRRTRWREWSLPIASLVGLGGIVGAALAPLGIGSTVAAGPAAAFSLLPGRLLVSGHVLVALAAAVALGLLALPLSRSR